MLALIITYADKPKEIEIAEDHSEQAAALHEIANRVHAATRNGERRYAALYRVKEIPYPDTGDSADMLAAIKGLRDLPRNENARRAAFSPSVRDELTAMMVSAVQTGGAWGWASVI